jgi:hypothetical protein
MMFERYAPASGGIAPERALRIAMLLPADPTLLAEVTPLIDSLATAIENDRPPQGADFRSQLLLWRMLAVSLGDYRRGNFPRSRDLAQRCLAAAGAPESLRASARAILAMTLAHQGQPPAAAAEVARAGQAIDTVTRDGLAGIRTADGYWYDWVIARILWREARATIIEEP